MPRRSLGPVSYCSRFAETKPATPTFRGALSDSRANPAGSSPLAAGRRRSYSRFYSDSLCQNPVICYYRFMAQFSFDIVSDYDKAELNNVFDQTQREITSRYDFKGTPAAVEWLNADKTGIKVIGSGDWQIDAILDIFRKKLAARGQSQKILDTSAEIITSNLKSSQDIPFKQGLDQAKAKQITNLVRDQFSKVKTQIQGDAVRVTSTSKDDLQAVMQAVRQADYDFPVNFTNYR